MASLRDHQSSCSNRLHHCCKTKEKRFVRKIVTEKKLDYNPSTHAPLPMGELSVARMSSYRWGDGEMSSLEAEADASDEAADDGGDVSVVEVYELASSIGKECSQVICVHVLYINKNI
jgi:hypothetical protein